MHNISLILTLIIFWFISSGIFDTFLLSCGSVSIICTFLFYKFFLAISEKSTGDDLDVYKKIPNLFIVIKNFLISVIKVSVSSISLTVNIILKKEIRQSIVMLETSKVKSNFYLMIKANSITMTPGSISVAQKDKRIYVHCSSEEIAKEITRDFL